MSIRLLLAVVFTVVLVITVAPALEDAQDARRTTTSRQALERVATTVSELVDSGEPPPAGITGARRTVTIDLPPESTLVLSDGRYVLRAKHRGRTVGQVVLPVAIYSSSATLGSTGRTTLTFSYERRGTEPMVVVTRGFIPDSEAKNAYAFTPGDASTGAPRDTGRHVVSMSG